MFFINKELAKLMQDSFLWTDKQMYGMNLLYYDTILKLIINDTFDYLEKNSLPENKEVAELQKKYNKIKDIGIISQQMKLLFSISNKYLELQNQLTNKINKLNADLCHDFVEAMDYETGLKVIEIMNKELSNIKKFEENYLKFSPQIAQNPKN